MNRFRFILIALDTDADIYLIHSPSARIRSRVRGRVPLLLATERLGWLLRFAHTSRGNERDVGMLIAMDRDEALKLLRGGEEGVAEWNRRRESGEETPNLREAVLREASLDGANLREVSLDGADLRAADLRGADLRMADLSAADLRMANLHGANLAEASLGDANFLGSILIGANLRGANIHWVIFGGADLRGAMFDGAQCWRTSFIDVDLSVATGLDSCRHTGPSSVGIDTLYRSEGRIPETFLRGCGVPDEFTEYARSLVGSDSAVQFFSCFISYSGRNEDFAKRLYSRLQDERIRVWFAPEDLKRGQKLHEQIDEAIRVYDKLLLVLSEDSMKSEWVATEIWHARQREAREERTMLFPIRLCEFKALRSWQCFNAESGKDMAREIREFYIPGDFVDWKKHDAFETAFERLLKDLRAHERKDDRPTVP